MKLKNYQEDLVLNAIDIVSQDRQGIRLSEVQLQDVAAYSLNRLPPRYIMSERGFTRMASQYWVNGEEEQGHGGLADLIELMLLVNRAIDVVTTRRRREDAETPAPSGDGEPQFWHNFPQFIGRVVDDKTGAPVYGARVAMLIDEHPAPGAEPGWDNPYVTNAATRGFFSFWPRALSSRDQSRTHQVLVKAEHDNYASGQFVREVETAGDLDTRDYIYGEAILSLERCALKRRN